MNRKLQILGTGAVVPALLAILVFTARETAESRHAMYAQVPKANELATQFLRELYPDLTFRVVCDPSTLVDSPRWRVSCFAAAEVTYPPLALQCPFLRRDTESGAKCVLR